MTSPLDELTDALKARLSQLESSIGLEGVTVSFGIDGDREASGRKKSAFNSVRSTPRGTGDPLWTMGEARVVTGILSKQVVAMTYRDAVFRGLMSGATATEEARDILARYDKSIARLMKQLDAEGPSEMTGAKCELCGELQFETPSGITCPNGHGGAGEATDIEEATVSETELMDLIEGGGL